MATIPLTKPTSLKNATLTIVADDYTAAVSQVQFDPSVSATSWTGIGGNVVRDQGVPEWTCTLGLAQDLTAGSLTRYLLANAGTKKAAVFTPAAGGESISATLVIAPSTLGGSADGNIMTASVQLSVDGQPSIVEAASVPILVSASPSGAAAGALLTISGARFTGATAVTVGGVAATVRTVVSDSTIVVVVPAGSAGSAPITVTNAAGASSALAYIRA